MGFLPFWVHHFCPGPPLQQGGRLEFIHEGIQKQMQNKLQLQSLRNNIMQQANVRSDTHPSVCL